MSEAAIVPTIIGSDCLPVFSTTDKFSPKPKRITAYCSIFFDVNQMPDSNLLLSLINNAATIPIIIAIIGPPIIGKSLPSKNDGTAMARQSNNPGQLFLIKFIFSPPSRC